MTRNPMPKSALHSTDKNFWDWFELASALGNVIMDSLADKVLSGMLSENLVFSIRRTGMNLLANHAYHQAKRHSKRTAAPHPGNESVKLASRPENGETTTGAMRRAIARKSLRRKKLQSRFQNA